MALSLLCYPSSLSIISHCVRGTLQLCQFFLGEWNIQHGFRAVSSDDSRHTQTNTVHAVVSVNHRGDRQHGMFIAHNGLRDTPHRHADTVIGCAFAVDNLVSRIAHMLVNAGKLVCGLGDAGNAAVIVQIGAGDVSARPYRQLAVAVLADDKRMHVAAVHAKPLPEQVLEPRSIQHGTGTEHTSGREAAQLLRQTGQHIDRIGYNQQDRLTIDCRKLCNDG